MVLIVVHKYNYLVPFVETFVSIIRIYLFNFALYIETHFLRGTGTPHVLFPDGWHLCSHHCFYD